ncbi:MAG: hypothetical protein IRY94_16155 [Rhodospirillaceae bacterium]|nr:hypothetical protein [Rhodospirillaceae bacterium]
MSWIELAVWAWLPVSVILGVVFGRAIARAGPRPQTVPAVRRRPSQAVAPSLPPMVSVRLPRPGRNRWPPAA